MKFDYNKLRGRIVEKFGSVEKFAAATGKKANTVNDWLRKGTPLKGYELFEFVKVLEIDPADIQVYFFTPKF